MPHFSQPSVHAVTDITAEFAKLGDFAVLKLAFIGRDAEMVRLDIYGESRAVERLGTIAQAINAAGEAVEALEVESRTQVPALARDPARARILERDGSSRDRRAPARS